MSGRRLASGILGAIAPFSLEAAGARTLSSLSSATFLIGPFCSAQVSCAPSSSSSQCSDLALFGFTRGICSAVLHPASCSLRPHGHQLRGMPLHPDTHDATHAEARSFASSAPYVSLTSLRDNPGATKKRIRVGRGNGSRRGNFAGRGLNGHNSRSGGGPHLLYDGGQLGLLKFPVRRERPPYEVLYTQLGIGKLLEYIQLGLLRHDRIITMKDLVDVGCVSHVKYGVLLYGKVRIHFPVHLQVTACDPDTKALIEAAGGTVTRVYYEAEGLRALLHPGAFTRGNLPLPQLAHSWHPRYNGKFDAIGQIPPDQKLGELVETARPVVTA